MYRCVNCLNTGSAFNNKARERKQRAQWRISSKSSLFSPTNLTILRHLFRLFYQPLLHRETSLALSHGTHIYRVFEFAICFCTQSRGFRRTQEIIRESLHVRWRLLSLKRNRLSATTTRGGFFLASRPPPKTPPPRDRFFVERKVGGEERGVWVPLLRGRVAARRVMMLMLVTRILWKGAPRILPQH